MGLCIWRVSSQNALYPCWSIWDIWDLSCWNIKKIIRKFVILLIITSKIFLYYNEQCIIRKVLFCIISDGALTLKMSKMALNAPFAIKLFIHIYIYTFLLNLLKVVASRAVHCISLITLRRSKVAKCIINYNEGAVSKKNLGTLFRALIVEVVKTMNTLQRRKAGVGKFGNEISLTIRPLEQCQNDGLGEKKKKWHWPC